MPHAGRARRSVALASLFATVLAVLLATGGPAGAAKKPPPPPPPPATPDWTVTGLRIEPVGPESELDVAGLGGYHGTIVLRAGTGGVSIVNQVAFDDYLRGIAEVPSDWPRAALEAQVIAARTYALHTLAIGQPLCASDSCQVYAGIAKERADTGGWAAAVAATKDQVLLYRGAPALTMYSSSNGGQMVAGSQPYLRAGPDPDDAVSPVHIWHSEVGLDVLQSVFATPGPVTAVARTDHDTVALTWTGPPSSSSSTSSTSSPDTSTTTGSTTTTSEPDTTTSSSPATTVPDPGTTTPGSATAESSPPPPAATSSPSNPSSPSSPTPTGSTSTSSTSSTTAPSDQPASSTNGGGGSTEVATADFVGRLNASQPAPDGLPLLLPSSRFTLRVDQPGGVVAFDGKGFGHGIGMSQFGALGKARRGLKTADILAAYYGGLRPVVAPAGMIPAEVAVTLDDGRADTTIMAPGRFRLIADDGSVLTPRAHGSWRFSSAPGGRIRITPPDDQRGPFTITPIGSRFSGDPVTGGVAEIHVNLSLPAAVKAAVLPTLPNVSLPAGVVADGPAHPADPAPVATADAAPADPGEAVITVPFAPGTLPTWNVRVEADAGAGRISTTELVLDTRFSSIPVPTEHHRSRVGGPGRTASASTSPSTLAAVIALLAAAWAALSRPFRSPDVRKERPRLPWLRPLRPSPGLIPARAHPRSPSDGVAPGSETNRWEGVGDGRRHDEESAGSGRPLRAPDPPLEPEDEAVHLR